MADDAMQRNPSDNAAPEGAARQTIDSLVNGKLSQKTVNDLGDAVTRAKANNAVGRVFGTPR